MMSVASRGAPRKGRFATPTAYPQEILSIRRSPQTCSQLRGFLLHAIRKTVLVAAVAAAAVWALPGLAALADAAAAPAIDGIRCDTMEGAVFHIHQHLAIFDHGKLITIPSDLGRPLM